MKVEFGGGDGHDLPRMDRVRAGLRNRLSKYDHDTAEACFSEDVECLGQGDRISKQLRKIGEEGIIPSCAFEFSAQ